MCRTAGKSSARSERSGTIEASLSFTSRTPATSRFRSTPRSQVYKRLLTEGVDPLQPYRETEMNCGAFREHEAPVLENRNLEPRIGYARRQGQDIRRAACSRTSVPRRLCRSSYSTT